MADSKMARLQAVGETGLLRLGSPARPWKTSICLGLTSCWVRFANSQPTDGTALQAQGTGFSGADAQTSTLKKCRWEPVGTGGSASHPGVWGGPWAHASPTASECSQWPRCQRHRHWITGPEAGSQGLGPGWLQRMLGQEHTGWLRPEEGPRGPKNPDRAWPVLIHIPKGLLHHAEDGHKRRGCDVSAQGSNVGPWSRVMSGTILESRTTGHLLMDSACGVKEGEGSG